MNIVIESREPEAFQLNDLPPYEDIFELHPLFDKKAFAYGSNMILEGPKGVGKTLSVASWAKANSVPFITCDCSEDLRRTHLVGTFVLRGDQTPFILGPMPTAIRVANAVGKAIICFEEINALSAQTQKLLNPITDFRRSIEIPEAHATFRLEKSAQLWVVGTMNTAVYGGVHSLNEDLRSRWEIAPLRYPNEEEELRILRTALPIEIKGALAPADFKRAVTLAQETRQGSIEYALAPRDLVQLLINLVLLGPPQALFLLTGKFEGDDRDMIRERIQSVYGEKV